MTRRRPLAALATILSLALATAAAAASPGSLPRVRSSDLVYRGAFLLPEQVSDERTFAYGGTALAYNGAHHSLWSSPAFVDT